MGSDDYEDARARLALQGTGRNRDGHTYWFKVRLILGLLLSAGMALWILLGLVR